METRELAGCLRLEAAEICARTSMVLRCQGRKRAPWPMILSAAVTIRDEERFGLGDGDDCAGHCRMRGLDHAGTTISETSEMLLRAEEE